MHFLSILGICFIFREVYCLDDDLEPVSSLKIYDAVMIDQEVMGEVDIGITDYQGVPELITTSPAVQTHEFVKADDKLTFKVWPSRSTMVDNNVFDIVATIKLNDASSVEATLKFYKIDIETDPALEAGESELVVVYDETMDDEDREETAFSCTFHDKEGLGNMQGGGIQHMESEATIVALLNSVVSARFDQLEQMEQYEDMDDDHDHDDHEHDHQEIYRCGFQFEYNGVSGQFGRQFTVKFKPDDRNWGAIIAACVIAGLILLLLIFFIIYRCCCVKSSKEKQIPPDLKTSRSVVQETTLSSPMNHPKFKDAVNFLDNVQLRFENQPEIYRTFLSTLAEFRSRKMTKADLRRKVGTLFEGHPDLVEGFNDFLRSGKNNSHESAGNAYTVVDIQVKKNPVANDSEKETVDKATSPESHPKFGAATQFVDQVQSRFVDQPEVYKTFLRILNDFKPKKMNKSELRAEVNILFDGHPDLIEGFNDFISSRKPKSSPESECIVVDLQGKKNGEVHTNTAVAEGKV